MPYVQVSSAWNIDGYENYPLSVHLSWRSLIPLPASTPAGSQARRIVVRPEHKVVGIHGLPRQYLKMALASQRPLLANSLEDPEDKASNSLQEAILLLTLPRLV